MTVKNPQNMDKNRACGSKVHFGHFLEWLLFLAHAKGQNTVICSVVVSFAWKNYFLQHAKNCVNTGVLARCCPLKHCIDTLVLAPEIKTHRKYHVFVWLLRRQTHRYLRFLFFSKKHANTTCLTIPLLLNKYEKNCVVRWLQGTEATRRITQAA